MEEIYVILPPGQQVSGMELGLGHPEFEGTLLPVHPRGLIFLVDSKGF
jgi:hypothetical protein